jgi:ATP-dependent Clp protease ATP-binding subunit ClpA
MPRKSNSDARLEAKLKHLRLPRERADQDTLVLKQVPANPSLFNKASTNILVKRPCAGVPCVVCVDEDLEYSGTDPVLARVFATGARQQGWRVLTFGGSLHGDLSMAMDFAIEFLQGEKGPGEGAVPPAVPSKGLLAAWAENLTDAVIAGRLGLTLGRNEEVEQVATAMLRWQRHLMLILGEAGTGKTNLLHGVASRLAGRKQKVLTVNTGAMMSGTLFESERETILMSLLREAEDFGATLALEQAEWAVIGVPRGTVLLREALDRGVRLVATTSNAHASRFSVEPLESRLEIVRLRELCAADTCRVLESLRPAITTHHGVLVDAEVERAVVERSLAMNGLLPGKAVGLLDAAAAHASLNGSTAVSLMDVYLAASRLLGESS